MPAHDGPVDGRAHRDVELVEVAPRDGLQNEAVILPTEVKVELITRAVAAGARRIEATSFVHPERVPQMADAEAVMAAVPRQDGVSYLGLALNRRGLDRAIAAGCDEVNLVVVASDTFSQRNQGTDLAGSLAALEAERRHAQEQGVRVSVTIAAAFGCPFEGEVPLERVVATARRLAGLDLDELALADTIGVAVPRDVHHRVDAVRAVTGSLPLRLHLHDTRATGVANAQAAIDAGVRVLDSSLAGLGGCPFAPAATGNVATEDLLYLLERSGVRTGWDRALALETVAWIEQQVGHPAAGSLARAGWFPDG